MSIIKNDDNIKSQKTKKKSIYELPAVARKDKEEISFEKALIIAFILHPLVVVIFFLSCLIMTYFGFDLFKKPEMKPKDIEFVLVEKEAPPIDKNTKNRSDKNSQAGGKHDPKRKVSLPQQEAPKAPAKKPTPPKAQKPAVQKPAVKPQSKPQPVQKPTPKPQQPVVQKPAPAPKLQAPKPTVTPTVAKPTAKPLSDFNIPIPKSAIPQIAQPTTAPVTTAPKVGGNASGSAGGSAAPSFSPTSSAGSAGSGTSAGGGGRFSNSYGGGRANLGNPGPGNPNGAPGIDAIKEPDFGPYMKELQRRIKMNWDPPKGNESKRVVLLFSIARDGRLLNVKVHRSSGLQAADNAAIEAVKLTAPFRPLPPEFKGQSVDIQFTFDYNVFGVSY
ncbi:MAG: TonB family protein [Candidatus Gastranaerophilales bacterium]|nr:TonB family protein [Candidatus Gastranaerophilales bacterium]